MRYKNELVAALLKEMELQRYYLAGETIETIYFGGGTPSLLSIDEMQSILQKAFSQFTIANDAEITIETNPDDITIEKLKGWTAMGVNRMSIGIQSFYDEDLQWMNRAHSASQAEENLRLATQYFTNITADLIYGTPLLDNDKWKNNVQRLITANVSHLSCYALTVEPKTPLQKMISLQTKDDVDPGRQSEQFLLLMDWLAAAGYEHYEISNFAKPGYRSKHNSSYWQGKKYLGIGPSAHSFNLQSRQWNLANNNGYIESINNGIVPFEKEELTLVQRMNEYIMVSLRTMEGIDLEKIDPANREALVGSANKFITSGILLAEGNFLKLTKEGKLLADGIAASLFF